MDTTRFPTRTSPWQRLLPGVLIIAAGACADDPTLPPASGHLEVAAVTTGATPDPNGYEITFDGRNGRTIAVDGVVNVGLAEGAYRVELTDVAMNCEVAGENPRTVSVSANATTRTTFEVGCAFVLREIAFSRDRDDYCDWLLWSCNDIHLMGADGASPIRLTDNPTFIDDQPAWSPDGARVLFTREDTVGNRSIYVIDADGSGLRDLSRGTADSDPAWSPDGTRVAFTRETDTGSDIFVIGADGGAPVNLTGHPGRDRQPAWSPDGTRIAFSSSRRAIRCTSYRWHCGEIYVMGPDGTGLVRLTTAQSSDGQPVWSPDGSRLLFTREDGSGRTRILVMDADGSNQRSLTAGPADSGPVWSPDGSRIAFTKRTEGSSPGGVETEVYIMALDGSEPVNVTNRPGKDQSPAWLPAVSNDPATAFSSQIQSAAPGASHSAVPVPYRGTLRTTEQIPEPSPPPGCQLFFYTAQTGHSTLLGDYEGTGTTCAFNGEGGVTDPPVNPAGGPPPYFVTEFRIEQTHAAANGDLLEVTGEGLLVRSLTDGSGGFVGEGAIVGGTGRFAGASGTFRIRGITGEPAHFHGSIVFRASSRRN